MNKFLGFLVVALSYSLTTCSQFNINLSVKPDYSLKQPITITQLVYLNSIIPTWSLKVNDYLFEINQTEEKDNEVVFRLKVLKSEQVIADEVITLPRGKEVSFMDEIKTESRFLFLPFLKTGPDKTIFFKISITAL